MIEFLNPKPHTLKLSKLETQIFYSPSAPKIGSLPKKGHFGRRAQTKHGRNKKYQPPGENLDVAPVLTEQQRARH